MRRDALSRSVVALCGGIGGAKLALGLYRVLPPHALTVVVNTGDDFDHLGLRICPDVDTVLYTLGGLSDPQRGWGRADETWNFMQSLQALGGPDWFQLGDRDLALHVERTRALAQGESLTAFTRRIARRLGIAADILPMSDDPVRTIVETDEGALPFQQYFVGRRCEPKVAGIRFAHADEARLSPELLAALARPDLEAVVICPSNPYLSVDPLLAVPGLRAAVAQARAPRVAVSPLIAGAAVKGPTAKIMAELGIPAGTAAIAAHYGEWLDGLVVDGRDAAETASLGVPARVTSTLMRDLADRERLAREVLDFARAIAGDRAAPSIASESQPT